MSSPPNYNCYVLTAKDEGSHLNTSEQIKCCYLKKKLKNCWSVWVKTKSKGTNLPRTCHFVHVLCSKPPSLYCTACQINDMQLKETPIYLYCYKKPKKQL